MNSFILGEHQQNLPTVRIKKVVLKHFKNVEHGEIMFNCGRQFIPCNTESDIIGIYGQNGSGKTAFIEALSILQSAMSGSVVASVYAECVAVDHDYAELEFLFDLQYPNGTKREAIYAFCMGKREATHDEMAEKYKNVSDDSDLPETESRVVIFNERFSLMWEDSSKRQLIIDTSSEKTAFVPDSKRKLLAGGGQKTLVQLNVNKQQAWLKSKSFIFMTETLEMLMQHNSESIFFQVLAECRFYAKFYLFAIETKSSGFIRLNWALPIYTQSGRLMLSAKEPMTIPEEELEEIRADISNISLVLGQLVPGLSIELEKLSDTRDKEGRPAAITLLVAHRDEKKIPLSYESDGVRKIISILALIIAAFNEQSVTVAIDEFDAGIYEYLLGEILQAMEESGKGQFIFTSHNLRPLEVINKKFLYFTTTNPYNRYIRLKKISATNNLRDTYFREIIVNEQDEEIYNRTKRYKIVAALKQAGGHINGKKA